MNMKPWYRKKTIWTAVIVALGAGLGHYTDNPKVAESVMIIGLALLAKLAVEDAGKGRLEVEADRSRRSDPPVRRD